MGFLDYYDDPDALDSRFREEDGWPYAPSSNIPGGDTNVPPAPVLATSAASTSIPGPPLSLLPPGLQVQGQTSPALPQRLQVVQDPYRSAPPMEGLTQPQFDDRFNKGGSGLNGTQNGTQIAPQSNLAGPSRFDDAQFDNRNYAGVGGPPSQLQQNSASYKDVGGTGFGTGEWPTADSMRLAENYAPYFIAAESGGDPTAKNKHSSATGTGQFTNGTWLDLYREYLGLDGGGAGKKGRRLNPIKDKPLLDERLDPQRSRQMMILYSAKNIDKLKDAGFAPTPRNTYLMHFLGPNRGGAITALKADPSLPAAQVLPKSTMGSNPHLQGKTIGQVIDWADQYTNKKMQEVDQRSKRIGYRLAPAAPIAFSGMPGQSMVPQRGSIDLSRLQSTLQTSGRPAIFLGR